MSDLSIKARPEIVLFYLGVAHLALRGCPLNTAYNKIDFVAQLKGVAYKNACITTSLMP